MADLWDTLPEEDFYYIVGNVRYSAKEVSPIFGEASEVREAYHVGNIPDCGLNEDEQIEACEPRALFEAINKIFQKALFKAQKDYIISTIL